MKTYILLFIFIFSAVLSASAQKDCQVRPIGVYDTNYDAVTLPHNPCEQTVEIYMILKENPAATIENINWRVVRSEMSDDPAEGWIIVDENNHNEVKADHPERGFIYTEPGPNGKSYFAAAIRSGRKAGVVKATVTDPVCGSKVATLAVRPGLMPVTLTDNGCTDAIRTYTATAVPSKQQNSVIGYTNTWIFPEYWTFNGTGTVTAGPAGYSMVTTADVNTASFITAPDPHPLTTEFVSVEVVALYKGNNGQGVGNANCDYGTNEIPAESCVEVVGCPAGESITDETLAGTEITMTYQGTTVSGSNTTVSFSFASEATIDQVLIQPLIFDPATTGVTATINSPDYTFSYDGSVSSDIIFTRTGGGSNNLLVSFTMPTSAFLEVYGLTVYVPDGGLETTYTGVEGDVPTCEFGELFPFAVELASFTGKATPSGIELNWSTASETNNDRFEVQRSSDGKDYKTVGSVKGAGNSSSALSYSYTDKHAGKGTNYYRLKMVETTGKIEFSNVIAIESSKAAATAMTLYPNPATGNKLTIAVDSKTFGSRDYMISITDINGRKVFEKMLNAQDEIDISLNQLNMSKGLYLVKIQGDNTVETQKLLIK